MTHSNTRSLQSLEQGPAAIAALDGLTSRHIDCLIEALSTTARVMTIDHHVDYSGYRSVIVRLDSSIQYVISGRADRIELAESREDELLELGCFADTKAVAQKIINRAR